MIESQVVKSLHPPFNLETHPLRYYLQLIIATLALSHVFVVH